MAKSATGRATRRRARGRNLNPYQTTRMNTSKLTLAQAQALVTAAAVNRSKAHNFAHSLHKHDPREAQAWADLKAAEEQVEIAGQALAEALKQPNANGQDDVSSPGHTPGPWAISPCNDGLEITSGRYRVAHLGESVRCPEIEPKANARLIAAAPELLGALIKLMDQYDSNPDFTMGGNLTNEPFLMARAAIAKATQA